MTHTLVPQSHRHRVNVLGYLTYQGGLTCESSLCGQDVITFLDRLTDTVTQQTCLFLDNASIHHGQAFQAK